MVRRSAPSAGDSSYRTCQKASVKPACANNSSIFSGVRGSHPASNRLAYHGRASVHSRSRLTTAPRAICRSPHHRSTCSSDRKSNSVAHVYATLSQKFLGGTAKCTTPSPVIQPSRTAIVTTAPQSAQRVRVSPSPTSDITPAASHAQLAQ